MAKVTVTGNVTKKHPDLNNDEEFKERLLQQVENENKEFYETTSESTKNISHIQAGVNTSVNHVLTAVLNSTIDKRVKEERLDAELYRAVQGNEVTDVQKLGEDSLNYKNSLNRRIRLRDSIRNKFKRIGRGAIALIGFNNIVQNDVVKRFGKNKDLNARLNFVCNRVAIYLDKLSTVDLDNICYIWNETCATSNSTSNVNTVKDLADVLKNANLSQLRKFRDKCNADLSGITFQNDSAFLDLMLLVNLNQRITSKIGLSETYDNQSLRDFWTNFDAPPPHGGGQSGKELKIVIQNILGKIDFSSFDKEYPNSDFIALIAEIRNRLINYNSKNPEHMPQAYDNLKTEIIDILNHEVSASEKSVENQLFNKNSEKHLTPFQLLQRFMRRDYMNSRGLPPSSSTYNKEANQYALLKAAMRVEDVKSIDRERSASNMAAEYMQRGFARRGFDKFKKTISKTQDFIGLEIVDFKNMTAEKLLKQLIESDTEFAVFKGINKYTTTRDLRHILNKKGEKVQRSTIERFTRMLEEALSQFKKVDSSLDKSVNAEDWDLELIISPLKKIKLEMWANDFLHQVENYGNVDREDIFVNLLKESRSTEEKIEKSIFDEVTDRDALWRVQLVKSKLKQILNKKSMKALKAIKQSGIEEKKERLTALQANLAIYKVNSPEYLQTKQDIDGLNSQIKVIEDQIKQYSDLHDRVNKAREYIKNNKLSRKQKREYLQNMGLTNVFDKMSQNFRISNIGKTLLDANSRAWKWSRESFLNLETAKKTYSIGRLAASPITVPLGWAWKAGTFPFRLVGLAMSRSLNAPWWLAGQVNKRALKRFYRSRIIEERRKLKKLSQKHEKLNSKFDFVMFSWDRNRILKQMDKLEEKMVNIQDNINHLEQSAANDQVPVESILPFNRPVDDSASIGMAT